MCIGSDPTSDQKVRDQVEFRLRLEREVQLHDKRVLHVLQDRPLVLRVHSLVPLVHLILLQDLHRVVLARGLVDHEKDLAEGSSSDDLGDGDDERILSRTRIAAAPPARSCAGCLCRAAPRPTARRSRRYESGSPLPFPRGSAPPSTRTMTCSCK